MKLREWLTLTRKSDASFADELGISRSMVWRITHGERQPSWVLAKAIVKLTKGAVRLEDF